MINFKVDEERCIQCKKCVADCPAQCITMVQGECPTLPEEDKCIRCQHCLAICPTAAISILGLNPDESLMIPHGLPTAHSMEVLVKGRRSVRSFKKQALQIDLIEKLMSTTLHAPTGINAQAVLLTTTVSVEVTETLRKEIYEKLAVLIAGLSDDEDSLIFTYLRAANDLYSSKGIDIILRKAPHILVASAPKNTPLPKEDCLIALTTFDLLAQANGVGTLWDGMLTWCLDNFFPELATKLGIPEDHKIGYCMVFGTPAMQYQRTVQRKSPAMNLVTDF